MFQNVGSLIFAAYVLPPDVKALLGNSLSDTMTTSGCIFVNSD